MHLRFKVFFQVEKGFLFNSGGRFFSAGKKTRNKKCKKQQDTSKLYGLTVSGLKIVKALLH
jgi:hypothetical protein